MTRISRPLQRPARTFTAAAARLRQRGSALLAVVVAVIAAVGLAAILAKTGMSSGASWVTNMFNMNPAQDILTSADGVNDGFNAVVRGGQAIATVAFNGLANAATDVLPSVNGPACLSAAGVLDQTASDCATLQPITIANYSSQIFLSAGGGATPPTVSGNMTNSKQDWIYTSLELVDGSAAANDLGTATPDVVMILRDVKLGVCEQINNNLWGDPINTVNLPLSGLANLAAIVANKKIVTAPSIAQITVSNIGSTAGRPQGCVQNTDGTNLYYRALAIQ